MLAQHIEAIIFASEQGTSVKEIQNCLQTAFQWDKTTEEIEGAVQQLVGKYNSDDFSFELVESGGGWQFLTKKDYDTLIATFLNQKAKKRLSTAALETLSIIAYKQPVTKAEIEQIRGVNCDYTVQKLLEKELVAIAGRQDGPGKPLLYATSQVFMDYFGINSSAGLPKLKEVMPQHDNEIGEAGQATAIETQEAH